MPLSSTHARALPAMLLAVLPAVAGAQIRTTVSPTVRGPIAKPVSIAGRAVMRATPAQIAAFRAGLRATVNAAPSSSPSPLASAALTWVAYPGASGYVVMRKVGITNSSNQLVMMGPTPVTSSPLPPSATSYTVQSLVPQPQSGMPIDFLVVALVSGKPVDTATVASTLPQYPADDDHALIPAANWPPPSPGPGVVTPSICMAVGNKLVVAWHRNPAAATYRLKLMQHTPSYVPYKDTVVTDTAYQAPLPTAVYLVYVRPLFLVDNWPSQGRSYLLEGRYSFFGGTKVGVVTVAPMCSGTYGI